MRELRRLLVEIYPPRLQEAGLEPALADLMSPLARRGIETRLEVPEGLDLDTEREALIFRVAQEAVKNASKHAEPHLVEVRVSESAEGTELVVEDDGRGMPADEPGVDGAADGHFGLRMLRDLTDAAGATLEIDSEPGRGTRVRMGMGRE